MPHARPRSRYSSLHGPHGPVGPACQKFSSLGSRMIRERGTPIASQTAMASSSGPRPSASSPSWTVIQMSSGLKPKPVERELPGVLGRALLEVLADREVAEHLEEGQVPGRRADVLDVDGAEALLAGGDERMGRLLDAQEVGLERLHARGREQDRGVEARGHERPAGQAQVVALLEEAQEELADLVGGHAAIVAHPSTASPRRKTAVCPGAGPSTGSASSIVSPRSVQGTAGAR